MVAAKGNTCNLKLTQRMGGGGCDGEGKGVE